MTTARQRPPRAHPPSNGTHNESLHSTRPYVTIEAEMGRRIYRNRRKRVPTTLVTATSVVLLLFLALARRVFVVISPRSDGLPSLNVLQTVNHVHSGSSSFTTPILTAFLEPPNTLDASTHPLPPRKTFAALLTKVEFPQARKCSTLMETWPINEFPSQDPFLPWIHDVFPSSDGSKIQFVAQNKRRCHLGEGKEADMKYWEPQISLLQPVSILQNGDGVYRLSSPQEATWNETRFQCRFHTTRGGEEYTTFSQYPFNYEYISWRKNEQSMLKMKGKDNEQFWLSQLLFSCPVPTELQALVQSGAHVVNDESSLWLDLVPIRTPARHEEPLFTRDHVGPESLRKLHTFDAEREWGSQHVLPPTQNAGRWANIPICPIPPQSPPSQRHRLVACTWTASSYTRRGDDVGVGDTALRLREWILFHELVGFDQVYVYDNTDGNESPLQEICAEFAVCKYHKWPAKVCSNNRPNHPNPGERSSQYAAEASCRERYGPSADWMAFIDTDEYLVPMKSDTWKEVLDEMDADGTRILKMRSSRARPRLDRMEEQEDQSTCIDPSKRKNKRFEAEPCVVPRKNETFLRTYNCEYIRPPRPDRFQRAMKQIYRPSHVWNHFVHYATVTQDVARLYKDHGPNETYVASVRGKAWERSSPEVFLNELTQGTLLHAKTVLPHETMYRSGICRLNSTLPCNVGYECPAHVEFSDELHTKNVFQDDEGHYCNCWANPCVEQVFAPRLQAALEEHERTKAGR